MKSKPQLTIRSFGIYSAWDESAKGLPKILEFTNRIPARVDIEFGFIANIKRGKNETLRYCIYHPGIRDDSGGVRDPFDGEVYVKGNDWDFFLGDTIWEPISDKLGTWRLTIELRGQVVADKSFEIVPDVKESPIQFFDWPMDQP